MVAEILVSTGSDGRNDVAIPPMASRRHAIARCNGTACLPTGDGGKVLNFPQPAQVSEQQQEQLAASTATTVVIIIVIIVLIPIGV